MAQLSLQPTWYLNLIKILSFVVVAVYCMLFTLKTCLVLSCRFLIGLKSKPWVLFLADSNETPEILKPSSANSQLPYMFLSKSVWYSGIRLLEDPRREKKSDFSVRSDT